MCCRLDVVTVCRFDSLRQRTLLRGSAECSSRPQSEQSYPNGYHARPICPPGRYRTDRRDVAAADTLAGRGRRRHGRERLEHGGITWFVRCQRESGTHRFRIHTRCRRGHVEWIQAVESPAVPISAVEAIFSAFWPVVVRVQYRDPSTGEKFRTSVFGHSRPSVPIEHLVRLSLRSPPSEGQRLTARTGAWSAAWLERRYRRTS